MGVTSRRSKDWLLGFIVSPGAYIDRGDSAAVAMLEKFNNVRMPDQPLTPEQLEEMFALLQGCDAKGGCKISLGVAKKATEATPEQIALGRSLFEGSGLLVKGGPPCVSCHNARGIGPMGGGTLAIDLTFTYARLGDQGLQSALESTPFPLMKDIYGNRPLTEAEAFAIKAYLYSLSTNGDPPTADANFLYAGLLGALFALGAIGLFWAGRMHGVRSHMTKRGKR